jgi:phosphatidylglycerol---prolipoprotein diacylglyceryl transferase
MYPNLYYVFKDWFGVDWKMLGFLNTFGLMVAIAFIVAAVVLSAELKRKEKQGLLKPREEFIIVGKPASLFDLVINFITGFAFGYKLLGLFINKPLEIPAQEYIFSRQGNLLGGLLLGCLLLAIKWHDANKQKLKEPEKRTVRIWPHDRVGDIIIIGLIFGILGAKLFDNFENWSEFIQHPIERLFSASGLTFYGGLILATIVILWYAKKKGIKLIHLVDAAAPVLLIGYAIGRIGCQVSGDGDWGVFNSAYITGEDGKIVEAKPGDFERQLEKYHTYFLNGSVTDSSGNIQYVTDRVSSSLAEVPHTYFKSLSFLPKWMVAYNYPNNVNKDGIPIKNCSEEHHNVLPVPVFPTPLYETVICSILFLFLWLIRRRIKLPGIMFSIYLILNGIERFCIETIRVNIRYNVFSVQLSQAEIIAILIVICGAALYLVSYLYGSKLFGGKENHQPEQKVG